MEVEEVVLLGGWMSNCGLRGVGVCIVLSGSDSRVSTVREGVSRGGGDSTWEVEPLDLSCLFAVRVASSS